MGGFFLAQNGPLRGHYGGKETVLHTAKSKSALPYLIVHTFPVISEFWTFYLYFSKINNRIMMLFSHNNLGFRQIDLCPLCSVFSASFVCSVLKDAK